MRNPIRLKNLNARFLPLYLVGIAILIFQPPQPHGVMAALPLIALGSALRAWGAGHLVKNDELTTSGPYAHLRHPLYCGTILIATGFAVWAGGAWTLILLCLLWPWFAFRYYPRKEKSESIRLEAAHGERFVRYRREVSALRPSLRPWRGDPTAGPSVGWRWGCYDENNELGTFLAVALGVILFWLRDRGPFV